MKGVFPSTLHRAWRWDWALSMFLPIIYSQLFPPSFFKNPQFLKHGPSSSTSHLSALLQSQASHLSFLSQWRPNLNVCLTLHPFYTTLSQPLHLPHSMTTSYSLDLFHINVNVTIRMDGNCQVLWLNDPQMFYYSPQSLALRNHPVGIIHIHLWNKENTLSGANVY